MGLIFFFGFRPPALSPMTRSDNGFSHARRPMQDRFPESPMTRSDNGFTGGSRPMQDRFPESPMVTGAGDLLLVLISVCVKDDLHWQYWPPLKPPGRAVILPQGSGEGRDSAPKEAKCAKCPKTPQRAACSAYDPPRPRDNRIAWAEVSF